MADVSEVPRVCACRDGFEEYEPAWLSLFPGAHHLEHCRFYDLEPARLPRAFLLYRTKDHSGVSGTGLVAYGVQYPDGKCATRWDTAQRGAAQTSVWDRIEDVEAIHGHNGDTQVVWLE